ncbi:Mbeg1-like protein [Coralloluteibacterium stylophorae]|uniref:DUF2974 domain-containing protein n=1 Tax=Coralloluteibacterium stylophorae TaxID=1776034 RepID=A0A8J8AWK6_9GAMM|nr:Mbeg1-like protein [Coralloluteibacterium stylophorae]MBS7457148.1 DUF2974 domain-containing protein [Coralloluteibacterium stylophorae]
MHVQSSSSSLPRLDDVAGAAARSALLGTADTVPPAPLQAAGRYAPEASYHPQVQALQGGFDVAAAGTAANQGPSFDARVRGQDAQAVDLELAQMAQDVYELGSSGIAGWNRLDDGELMAAGIDPAALEDSSTGFRAAIYTNGDGDHVLAFAGTDATSLRDWAANLGQGLGMDTSQYNQAVALAKDAKLAFGDDLVITGHSLGGGLASSAAIATDSAAVTFNAAGLTDSTLRRIGVDPAAAKQQAEDGGIRRYAVADDILTDKQEHDIPTRWVMADAVGHKIELDNPDPMSWWEHAIPGKGLVHSINSHLMGAVLDALGGQEPWN